MKPNHTPQSFCQFGIARRDITPPVGIYHRMWGAATHDQASGVHQPLSATAMALQALPPPNPDSPPRIVLVTIDHCLLHGKEMATLRQFVATRSRIGVEELIVTFSHTHSAGLMDLDRADLPGGKLIPTYLHHLAELVAEAVTEALERCEPVNLTYGIGHCTLGAHRDLWDPQSNQYVCGFNPDGPVDPTVLVARVHNGRGMVATIVNYACHPTTLAWQNTLISPDFPGSMRDLVERETGAPCAFLQGASGDVGPVRGFVGDVSVAERNGRILGYAVLSALENLPGPGTQFEYRGPVVSGATIGTWSDVPLDDQARSRCSGWRLRQFEVPLGYRADLPTMERTQSERDEWQRAESEARARGDDAAVRHARAMTERMTRIINRLKNLPSGNHFPLPVTLLKTGDACWVAVECEHYNRLQHELRARFPQVPILVTTLANGSRATYLPTQESYGHGIYQESIALLAAGSLERLIQVVGDQIGELVSGR